MNVRKTKDIALVVILAEAIDLVLNEQLNGSKLLLITTGQEILIVYTNRYIKKLISNKEFSVIYNRILTSSAFGYRSIASEV